MDLKAYRSVALDTMVFIHLFEGSAAFTGKISKLFREIEKGAINGVTTVITISEILAKPLAEQNIELADEYKNVINGFPHLRVQEINQHIAVAAAALKAKYSIRLPDALQIAGGIYSGAQAFVTNDK